ncbi:MAG: nuclear transport factor 2 family protein, partial [Actinomycetota bacterium]
MASVNVDRIRAAYESYSEGDYAAVLTMVDPEFEWTYLDPSFEHPEPQVCHGPGQLVRWMARQSESGLRTEIVEVLGHGDKVLVVTRTPGIEGFRA